MKIIKLALLAVALGLGVAAAALFTLRQQAVQPASPISVDIPLGTGTRRMAELLSKNGVVASPWHFLAARALRPRVKLQAGLYDFSESATAAQVLDRIVRGDVHFEEITIPEGSNIWDISGITAQLGWFTAEDFLNAARDPALVAELLPEVRPAPASFEGYLFPSTYRLAKNETPRQIIAKMTGEFRRVWSRLEARLPVNEAVTLASLVEKETGVAGERPIVASVYRNRLDRGMLLGCDPTVIYAALLDGRYRGVIHQSDLESEHPYNTYQHPGLPPGPIASPGEASLRAALNPADTKFLFFVAKGDGSGGHNFTANAAEHGRAVARYRAALAAAK
jgi:UPF0755 protein